jgi:molybdopterin-guanine dinucleotide biosynthesis protein B
MHIPVVGLVGSSGSGKTTLIERVIPLLAGQRLRVAVIKHAHHGFDMDQPGKDSYRLREAGAEQVLVASSDRWVLMRETPEQADEPRLRKLAARFRSSEVDLILAEGFSGESHPKIEVYRPSHGRAPRCWPGDPTVRAVASDVTVDPGDGAVWLDLNDPAMVTQFILALSPAAHWFERALETC